MINNEFISFVTVFIINVLNRNLSIMIVRNHSICISNNERKVSLFLMLKRFIDFYSFTTILTFFSYDRKDSHWFR